MERTPCTTYLDYLGMLYFGRRAGVLLRDRENIGCIMHSKLAFYFILWLIIREKRGGSDVDGWNREALRVLLAE